MSSREFTARFHSPVAALMEQFVQQKQACGYKYGEAARILARFDRFLCDEALSQCELPRCAQPEVARQTTPRELVNTPDIASRSFVSSPCTCAGWAIPPMCRIDR